MKRIVSRHNPLFKSLRKLSQSARERKKTGRMLLDGMRLLSACGRRGGTPVRVVLSPTGIEDAEILAWLTAHPHVPQVLLDTALFNEIAPVETPTGILAVADLPRFPRHSEPSPLTVLLEDIQDPGNLGSILRSAAGAGCREAFLSQECADPWSPRTLRAGMGAHFLLALREGADLPAVARAFPGKVVATAGGTPASLYAQDLRGSVAFAFGNEGAGLSAELRAAADAVAAIPLAAGVESLNVAAAAAICCFEWVRQRLAPPFSA